MTISTESTRVEYTGDGATLPFAVPFKFLVKTDIVVVLRTILTGVEAVQTIYTHYTVTGAGDASGTVTFVTAPPSTQRVVIYNDPPLTQLVDYIAGGTFPAETHEEALDRLTIQQKRTREITTRAILLPDADTDGSGAYDAKSNRIKNLGTPIATTDAATKTYTDTLVNNTALGPAPTGLIATGSVTSRLLADRWGEVKNVKDFGATGDGVTDDRAALQAALDAASAAANTTTSASGQVPVIIPDGTYLFSMSGGVGLTIKANTHVIGFGGILKLMDGQAVSAGGSYYPVWNQSGGVNQNNVMVESVVFDGNGANNATFTVCDTITLLGQNVQLLNCTLKDAPDSAVMFSAVDKSSVRGCFIDGARDSGVYINDSVGGVGAELDCSVSQNRITNTIQHAIGVKRYAKSVVISGNSISSCGNGIVAEEFTSVDAAQHTDRCVIADNIIRDIAVTVAASSDGVGIKVMGESGYTITGNVITDTKSAMLNLSGSSDSTVTGNVIIGTANGSTATTASGNHGILLSGRTGLSCTGNSITGNVIKDVGARGIWLLNNAGTADIGNTVSGNTVTNSTSDALRIDSQFTGCVISNNRLDGDAGDFDINVTSGAGVLTGNVYSNNVLVNNTFNGFMGSASGSYSDYGPRGGRTTVGLVIPTAGAWLRGDLVWNYTPTPGASAGWICMTAGTPGTWQPFGALAGITALANDATPTVAGGSTFITGGTTTITDFDDGAVGQTITVLSEHAVTITDGTNIILHGSANFVMAASDSLTLVLKADNKWYETARMVN